HRQQLRPPSPPPRITLTRTEPRTMRTRSHPPARVPRLLHGFLLAVSVVLTGCANGDFGEVKPILVRDDIHDWVGHDALGGRSKPSSFELTDDERLLRDLAYPLIEPPFDRQRF